MQGKRDMFFAKINNDWAVSTSPQYYLQYLTRKPIDGIYWRETSACIRLNKKRGKAGDIVLKKRVKK
jgi:hypothetical protein